MRESLDDADTGRAAGDQLRVTIRADQGSHARDTEGVLQMTARPDRSALTVVTAADRTSAGASRRVIVTQRLPVSY
jgi:hypothetical protein